MKWQFGTFIMVLAFSLVGCGKSIGSPSASSSVSAVPYVDIPNGPYQPTQTGIGQNPGSDFAYGGTGAFSFIDTPTYEDYTQRDIGDISQLSNVEINLNLMRFDETYGGTVTIRYQYNGQTYEGYFTSGASDQSNQYNVWFNSNGKKVWHGFFEDFMGAIVVVIDGSSSLGDGTPTSGNVSGSVWYKNFGFTHAPHPPTYCWFVSIGPYDCQAWPNGAPNWDINTTAGVYPDSGYKKLGSFTGVNVISAFNNELSP